jgi:hypothetical protein
MIFQFEKKRPYIKVNKTDNKKSRMRNEFEEKENKEHLHDSRPASQDSCSLECHDYLSQEFHAQLLYFSSSEKVLIEGRGSSKETHSARAVV